MFERRFLVTDYETYSEADLELVGGDEYSKHKSTEVMCVGFRYGTRIELKTAKTFVWVPRIGAFFLKDGELIRCNEAEVKQMYLRYLGDKEVGLVAHNAFFEQVITKNVLGRDKFFRLFAETIPLERWHCTAATARVFGLAGKLATAAMMLKLDSQKDSEGHSLMLQLSKPRKPTKKDPSTRILIPEKIIRLALYCAVDIKTTVDLFLRLPLMSDVDRSYWLQDQRMNHRGFAIDRNLAMNAKIVAAKELSKFDSRVKEITNGRLNSTRQLEKLHVELQSVGCTLTDLSAESVRDALSTGDWLDPYAEKLLQIRKYSSKSSTTKFFKFEARSRWDGRGRDNTIFYGAHTGRQSGTGLQPQNLFKSTISDDDLKAGMALLKAGDFDAIEALYENPLDLCASALRGCIISEPGKKLFVGDWATIEVRVLFWLAGHTKGLDSLASGVDLYIQMAGYIFNLDPVQLKIEYEDKTHPNHKKAAKMRQLGKQTVLGAGYGIGLNGKKFQATCKQYEIEIDIETAQKAIAAYRELHAPIVSFWANLDRVMAKAVFNRGKTYELGKLRFKCENNFLRVRLPSGRFLSYFEPRIERKKNHWGDSFEFRYTGLNKAKLPCRVGAWGGKLAENFTQAVAACVLYEALIALEVDGEFPPCLAIHDEDVSEGNENGSLERFLKIMGRIPKWAPDLPLKVEGWKENRYRK